jgi:glyoxylase-like metal-dependent hydrolase (beta-lactamase superfamily II)
VLCGKTPEKVLRSGFIFTSGEPFIIDEDVKVVPTPGHTLADVTLLVNTKDKGLIAVTGNLQ